MLHDVVGGWRLKGIGMNFSGNDLCFEGNEMICTRSIIKMANIICSLCVFAVLAGCAATKVPDDFQIWLETPKENESIIYYMDVDRKIKFGDYYENGRAVRLSDDVRYFADHTTPGYKVISYRDGKYGDIDLLAKPGERYFVYRECFMSRAAVGGIISAMVILAASMDCQLYEIDEESATELLRSIEWLRKEDEAK